MSSKGCEKCRRLTDLLLASYDLKMPKLSDAILDSLIEHAKEANHNPNEGWALVKNEVEPSNE